MSLGQVHIVLVPVWYIRSSTLTPYYTSWQRHTMSTVSPTASPFPIQEGGAPPASTYQNNHFRRGSCGVRRPRGGSSGGRGDRDGGQNFRSGRERSLPPNLPFTGDTTEMNKYVFQCRSENADPKQFAVTLEKLPYYVKNAFNSASDLESIFNDFTTPTVVKTTKPETDDDAVEAAIF